MSDNPLQALTVAPEFITVATEYVKHLDVAKTAAVLKLPVLTVTGVLDKKEVQRYVDAMFLQQGYMQRNKLNDVLSKIIDLKLDEMEETEMGSNKDILEILKFAHTMSMDHAKLNKEDKGPSTNVKIEQNFGGDNYSKLLERIVSGDEPVASQ